MAGQYNTYNVINQRLLGSRRAPQPPRNIVAQPSSFGAVVTWGPPEDSRGITGWIVYLDSETTPFSRPNISELRTEIPINSGASRFGAVSAVNANGVESPRIPFIATANSDLYDNGSPGTSPPPPGDYRTYLGTGQYGYGYH